MKYDNKNDELILQEPHSYYLLFVFEENGGKCKKSPDVIVLSWSYVTLSQVVRINIKND